MLESLHKVDAQISGNILGKCTPNTTPDDIPNEATQDTSG